MRNHVRWSPPPPRPLDRQLVPAQALLLCLPYPGFGASMYQRWPITYDGMLFCPIQLPGRDSRAAERARERLPELAADLAEELSPYLDCPFAFFGHGEAALLAYEITVQICATGMPTPSRLYVSAQAPPHHGPHDRLARLSARERCEQYRELLHRIQGDGTPAALTACLRLLDADLAALARYRPIEAIELACPVVAIGWSGDRQVDQASMRGWVECGPTTFVVLDGDHAAVVEPPPALLELLAADLVPRPGADRTVDCGG